ncbi:MAG: zinc-ribbon domain-containing protein, partial [Tepidimonas sp.]|nr:zinc-ribbon domain-containing protein [Tepidimonas sp.]
MRFLTRCPSCGTTFRVVVDQLKIADGWVRCGFCQRVFDATQDLQPEEAPPAPTPAAITEAQSGPKPEPTPSNASPPPPTDADGALQPQAVVPLAGAPAPLESGDAVPSQAPGPLVATSASAGPEPTTVPPPAAGAIHAGDEPAFVRAARRRARWRHPWVRWTLAATALLLAGLLAAQLAWLGRDALLARWPGLQPVYAWVCAPLGCTVGPRRDPQAVVVEGSVLLRRAPDRYSFHLVLRNQT